MPGLQIPAALYGSHREVTARARAMVTRIRIPVESTQPQDQNDFMKEMTALTGLTGTALIISEGSRVAFGLDPIRWTGC